MYSGVARLGQHPPVQPVDRDLHVVIERKERVADGAVSLRLVAADGGPLPRWRPGCHLDVLLPSGRLRQYSLCGDPTDRSAYRIAVRRIEDGGGGSLEVHDTLRKGDELRVRGPRNAFPFLRSSRYLFIAGGIGITPILPMVRTAQLRGADWRLVYTGRTRDSLPFLDELHALCRGRVRVRADDEHGGLPDPADLLAGTPPDATVYCCGPPPLIEGVHRLLPVDRPFHYERFSPPPIVDGTPFEVELRGSGRVLPVPADRTALEVVREVLPDVAYSCQQGFCGTCRVRVLAGVVDHRDHVLTDDERAEEMTICVSRSRGGRIVLDL
nr:PDR/VanB family oxidoreductase [Longimycelium tulufanense]